MTGPTEALAAFGAGAMTADLGDTILGWAIGVTISRHRWNELAAAAADLAKAGDATRLLGARASRLAA